MAKAAPLVRQKAALAGQFVVVAARIYIARLSGLRKPPDPTLVFWAGYGHYRREVAKWARRGRKGPKPQFRPRLLFTTVRTAKGREITPGAPNTLELTPANEVEVMHGVLDRRRIARLAKAYEATTGPPQQKRRPLEQAALSPPRGVIGLNPPDNPQSSSPNLCSQVRCRPW